MWFSYSWSWHSQVQINFRLFPVWTKIVKIGHDNLDDEIKMLTIFFKCWWPRLSVREQIDIISRTFFRRQHRCSQLENWPKLRTYLDNMRKSKSGTIISAPDLDFWTHLNVLLSLVWPRKSNSEKKPKINSSPSSDSIF